jgi:hypothetical protein
MLKTFFIQPIRENHKSAVLVALIGCSVGVVWSVNAAWSSLPSVWAIILCAEVGVVCTLISWVAFSALFAQVFKHPTNSVRPVEAVAHLTLLFYSLAGLDVVLHIRFLGHYMSVAALKLFVAAKIAEIIYFGLPKKIGVSASVVFFNIAAVLG